MKKKRIIYFKKKPISKTGFEDSRVIIHNIAHFCRDNNIKLKQCKISIYSGLSYIEVKCNDKNYANLFDYMNSLKSIKIC